MANPTDVTPGTKPVSPETQLPPEKVSQETPPTQTGDESKELTAMRERLARYETDINKMKATFQRRETAANQALQQAQENHMKEIESLRRGLMDEKDLQTYDATRKTERLSTLESELADAKAALNNERTIRSAFDSFISLGVPAEILNNAIADDGGLPAMSGAAWSWLDQERKRLAVELEAIKNKKTSPEPLPQAPNVATPASAGGGEGLSRDDLKKKYGSMERVYQLIESGQLPASVLPWKK